MGGAQVIVIPVAMGESVGIDELSGCVSVAGGEGVLNGLGNVLECPAGDVEADRSAIAGIDVTGKA
jgi:hypothetical protein